MLIIDKNNRHLQESTGVLTDDKLIVELEQRIDGCPPKEARAYHYLLQEYTKVRCPDPLNMPRIDQPEDIAIDSDGGGYEESKDTIGDMVNEPAANQPPVVINPVPAPAVLQFADNFMDRFNLRGL